MTRLPAIETATALVRRRFPDCRAAFMAGSVVRGDATATSDLDIMVIVPDGYPAYRESLRVDGWPVELFIHTLTVHRRFAQHDAARRMPATSRMVCEGIVVCDRDGLAGQLKEEACALLAAGPAPLTEQELASARYFISDLMDDLIDARPDETPFIAWELAQNATNLILDWRRQWRGRGKWLLRALRHCDPALADRLAAALHEATNGDTTLLTAFADDALALAGGRLWEGYRAEAPKLPQ
ncbi:MAG: nucleotidyltransferase domain-containing protein [Anaerolineae bacterium]|nr:nucleotidyltransferase domain-containing protein [Anaerolineae bacterium]MCB0207022.1 nucleotidyltransferase domain-containing protein [Anaerolineae bacterium]MCB0253632.1 nucleotidyltransferase domain-containing protein [Anaerolineae bacterium]